ncbi:MAG TPA: twin-arginine translocase subunit TatC [Dehalococcoidia bacterium]|nr:twin-arginine translocase subunit TatC [Dehalococcoidia bacterium]
MTTESAAPSEAFEGEPLPEIGDGMTLMEHLKEVRNRVFIGMITLVITTVICFIFWETIVGWLIAPAREERPEFQLAVFSPTETIGVLFKVGLYGGLILSSPMWVYQFIMFVLPGLTPKEKKAILPGLAGVILFMLGGMAFAYWIILPASLGFLLDFGSSQFDPVIGARQYLDFAIRIIFWVGLSFELPMVIALLARLGMVRARQLLGFWRYAIVLVFLAAAIVTPTPDPLTQSLVAGPLLILYGVGILFALVLQPPAKPEPAR